MANSAERVPCLLLADGDGDLQGNRLLDPRGLLPAASRWYEAQSRGRFHPHFELAARGWVEQLGRFRGLGGLERWPLNSQALVAELLEQIGDEGRRALASHGAPPIILAPAGFRPHCWHLHGGGRRLEGGGSCWRYALLPADVSLGAVVHELGHLLFDWPDLARGTGLGSECLMATGATLGAGQRPAPPCAALRVRAGWVEPELPARETRVRDLEGGRVFAVGEDQSVLVELRAQPWRLLSVEDRPRPRLRQRLELRDRDLERPLLAVLRPRA